MALKQKLYTRMSIKLNTTALIRSKIQLNRQQKTD